MVFYINAFLKVHIRACLRESMGGICLQGKTAAPLLCAHAQYPGSALGFPIHSPHSPTPLQRTHKPKLSSWKRNAGSAGVLCAMSRDGETLPRLKGALGFQGRFLVIFLCTGPSPATFRAKRWETALASRITELGSDGGRGNLHLDALSHSK